MAALTLRLIMSGSQVMIEVCLAADDIAVFTRAHKLGFPFVWRGQGSYRIASQCGQQDHYVMKTASCAVETSK